MRGGILAIGIILLVIGLFIYFPAKSDLDYLESLEETDIAGIPVGKTVRIYYADRFAEAEQGIMYGTIFGLVGFIVCLAGVIAPAKEKERNIKKQELKIRATQAMSKEYLRERTIRVGEGIVGLVAKDRKPVIISDVLKDKRYKEKTLARKEKLVSMLSVPMMVKKRVIGVVNCYTTTPYKFTKSDVDLLSAVGNQAAVAIENTELLVRTKVVQQELEARKKVERAKGILMREQGLSEEEAYNLIRSSSHSPLFPAQGETAFHRMH